MIIKLANGRWKARLWTAGRGSTRLSKTFDTKKDAERWQRLVKTQCDAGTYIAPKAIPTFREAAEEWLAAKADRRLATILGYQIHLDIHLLPMIGDLRLDQITVAIVEKQVRDELRKTLGVKTVNKVLGTLGQVYKMAVRRGYCSNNPLSAVERLGHASPEIIGGDDQPHDSGIEVLPDEVLSASEIRLLLANASPGLYRTLLMVLVMTGLRDGELLALRWSDIEFTTAKLYVRRSLSWARLRNSDEEPQPRFYPPKTKHGIRAIGIAPELVSVLKAWKLQCPKGELDLVFPTPNGASAHRSNVLRYGLYPALRRAGLRRVSLHSLRHSFASILIMQGTPITEVQYLLGHSSPQTTLKVYSHFLHDVKTGALEMLAKSLTGDGGPSVDPEGVSDAVPVAVNQAKVPEFVGESMAPPARLERATPGLGILCLLSADVH